MRDLMRSRQEISGRDAKTIAIPTPGLGGVPPGVKSPVGLGDSLGLADPPGLGLGDPVGLGDSLGLGLGDSLGLADALGLGD